MSGSKEAVLRAAYTDLVKAEQCQDYERGLKICNRILKSWQNAKEAFRCKVVCLVKLGKFAEALTVIKKAVPKLQATVQVEKAYCEYRENQAEAALTTLEGLGDSIDAGGRELLAQLYYRLERYADARGLYQGLLKEVADDEEDLRIVNLQACEVQLAAGSSGISGPEIPVADEDGQTTYEQLYNLGCRKIAGGDFKAALRALAKAEAKCREQLTEDEWPEEEVEEELAILRIQAAYAQQCLGKTGQATAAYQDILNRKPSDLVVLAVAATNLVALKGGESNLFDSRKKLKVASSSAVESKLLPGQRRVAAYNNALLLLHSNQLEPCRKAIAELKAEGDSRAEEEAVTLETALLIRQKEAGKAIALLAAWRDKSGELSPSLRFALAQVHLMEGDLGSGREALESLEARWTPGPLSLAVALRLAGEDGKGAVGDLKQALGYWQKTDPKGPALLKLMEETARLHLRLGATKEASKLLEELRAEKPTDPGVLAALIQAYAQFQPAKAEELSESLASLGSDGGLFSDDGLDVDALEEEGGLALRSRYGKKKEAKATPKPGGEEKTKRKKKRKIRLPKNLDPDAPPDPERWLPRYERSTYRRRKDKRKGDREIGRGAQGAVSGAAEALDMSGKTGVGPASPKAGAGPSPAAAAAPGPRQQRPGGQAKGKKKPAKKGGGKW